MTNKALGIIVCGLAFVVLMAYWFVRQPRSLENAPTTLSKGPAGERYSESVSESEIRKRSLALEVRRTQLDQTVWANELLAQKHEEVFIELWNALRNQDDSYAVLTNFPFSELRLGTLSEPTVHEHNISVGWLANPVRSFARESWRQELAKFKAQGFRLEQSEWRHARFTVATNGPPESVFFVSLHALNSATKERYILRGDLRVVWREPTERDEKPFPAVIEVANLEVLSRQGETPFHHVLVADLTPEKMETKFLEPSLHLYDLDGDGLSEIIFPQRNRVFWNRGQGVFGPDELLAYPLPALRAGLFADFDNDGLADFLAADAQGLALYAGDAHGHFLKPPKRVRFTSQKLPNPLALTAGDIDGDGDLDVWLAQYKVPYQRGQVPTPFYDANDGYPAFLLLNDGQGNFVDRTEESGLGKKRFRRTYSSSFVDLDDDGDLDLVVVSDFAGADVYLNDGHGHFTDVTARVLDEARCFGMAHTFGDYDLDGHLDFFVIGMNSFVANRLDSLNASAPEFPDHTRMRSKMAYGNRLYLWRDGRFGHAALSEQVARSGWSWGVTTGDFDNDGDPDLYVVNGHISGRSAKDYETEFWRHDIYLGSSMDDPALDQYFRSVQAQYYGAGLSYGGHEKNRLYLNRSGKSFLEAGYLMGVALEEDCRNAASDDLDGDGKLDLLVTTFQAWPKPRQALHLFPNFTEGVGNWIGIRLRESRPGNSPIGAKVILTSPNGKQIRHFVTGDSYRSQHATTAHFGLGRETQVKSVEVVWPNGRRKTMRNPGINRYHLVRPDRE